MPRTLGAHGARLVGREREILLLLFATPRRYPGFLEARHSLLERQWLRVADCCRMYAVYSGTCENLEHEEVEASLLEVVVTCGICYDGAGSVYGVAGIDMKKDNR